MRKLAAPVGDFELELQTIIDTKKSGPNKTALSGILKRVKRRYRAYLRTPQALDVLARGHWEENQVLALRGCYAPKSKYLRSLLSPPLAGALPNSPTAVCPYCELLP